MKQLLRQPLLHFLLLGGVLFLVYQHLAGPSAPKADAKTIIINREALLDFLQYRSQAFNRRHFEQELAAMSLAERQRLIGDLAREEVLYREALTLGLNENDYVIKRRLTQKLEYLTQGFITAGPGPTEAEIDAYYDDHREDYHLLPSVTFTHVFFDYERHSHEEARQLADQTLRELNDKQVVYADAVHYGDRFLYHVNYVERASDYVADQFGAAMAEAVFALTPDSRRWQGPFGSPYGLHLVLLTQKTPGRIPELDEIHDRVRDDAGQARVHRLTEAAINDLIKGYKVEIARDLQP